MLKLPRIQWPDLIMHIPTMVVYYAGWILAVAVVIVFSHGIVMNMFENIPGAEITWAVIVLVTAFVVLLAIVSDFIANKKEEDVKAKKAKLEGAVYDEVNGEISQKMFWGYPLIASIGSVVVATLIVFGMEELATSEYAHLVSTEPRALLVGTFLSIVAFFVVDRFVLRKVMDGLFFKEIEKPAIDAFLGKTGAEVAEAAVKAVTTVSERVKKLKAAGLSNEEIDDIIAASKK